VNHPPRSTTSTTSMNHIQPDRGELRLQDNRQVGQSSHFEQSPSSNALDFQCPTNQVPRVSSLLRTPWPCDVSSINPNLASHTRTQTYKSNIQHLSLLSTSPNNFDLPTSAERLFPIESSSLSAQATHDRQSSFSSQGQSLHANILHHICHFSERGMSPEHFPPRI
jgi:hypothetical protein